MYVCSCFAVTDGQIKDSVRKGTCKTWRDVTHKLKVGTQCGICAKSNKKLFEEIQAEQSRDLDKKS